MAPAPLSSPQAREGEQGGALGPFVLKTCRRYCLDPEPGKAPRGACLPGWDWAPGSWKEGGLQHPTLMSMPSSETPLYPPLPKPGFCPGVHSDGSHGPAQKANLPNSWERRKELPSKPTDSSTPTPGWPHLKFPPNGDPTPREDACDSTPWPTSKYPLTPLSHRPVASSGFLPCSLFLGWMNEGR